MGDERVMGKVSRQNDKMAEDSGVRDKEREYEEEGDMHTCN